MKLRKVLEDPKQDYFTRLAHIESSNNPLAKAKTSSAAGLYQFTKGTWEGLTKQLGLNYTLDDRFDPKKSRVVVEEFTKQNERFLKRKLGRQPNDAELYLAHFSGMGGADKLLKSLQEDPNTDVREVFKDNQIKANKNVFLNKDGSYKTVRDVYNWAANKFNVSKVEKAEMPKISINSEEFLETIKDNTDISFNNKLDTLKPVQEKTTLVEQQPTKENTIVQQFSNIFQSPEINSNLDNNIAVQPYEQDLSYLYNYIKLTD